MKTQKPLIGSINSSNLMEYKLTKAQLKLLGFFDELESYQPLANKRPPHMRLKRADYSDLDASIRKQSDGQRSLGNVFYKGYSILSMEEKAHA